MTNEKKKYKLCLETTHPETGEPIILYFHDWGFGCCFLENEKEAYIFCSSEKLNERYWSYWPQYQNQLKIIEI